MLFIISDKLECNYPFFPNEVNMNKKLLFLALLVMVLGSACALPTILSGPGSNNSADVANILKISSDPIRVSPVLDNALQMEAIIPVEGGSLSVVAADGTQFRLDISAGALVEETLVRMIPLSGVEDMPFGSQPLAVQLEPDGLQLYNFATLTITPVQEIPVDQQLFFGYQGAGENFALVPPIASSQEIKLVLPHFSGYGVTKGFLADVEPVRARIGGDAETRIQSAVAEQLSRSRQKQLLGIEDDQPVDFEAVFKQYEEQVLKPRIAAAGESCAAGRLAIQTLLGMQRQRQLLGFAEENPGMDTLTGGLMDTVAEVCMKEEYEMCRDDHIIQRIIPAWLGIERQYQLLGVSDGNTTSPVLEKVRDYVRKCLTFELRFSSQASFDDGGGGGYDSNVESKIKLQFNPNEIKIQGQAPLVNTAFEFKTEGCSVTSNRGGSTFEAMDFSFTPGNDPLGNVQDFRLLYYPGNTTESFTVACPDQPSYTSPPSPLWTGIYLVIHEFEMNETEGGFLMTDWEVTGGEYYARKEWVLEDAANSLVEAGTFKLYHIAE